MEACIAQRSIAALKDKVHQDEHSMKLIYLLVLISLFTVLNLIKFQRRDIMQVINVKNKTDIRFSSKKHGEHQLPAPRSIFRLLQAKLR